MASFRSATLAIALNSPGSDPLRIYSVSESLILTITCISDNDNRKASAIDRIGVLVVGVKPASRHLGCCSELGTMTVQ